MKVAKWVAAIFSRTQGKPESFPGLQDAENRLRGNQTPLTEIDFERLFPWLGSLSAGAIRRLEAEFAVANIRAIKHLHKISARIGVWTLLVNIVLFVLTLAALIIALKSYEEAKISAQQQQQVLDSSNKALQDTVRVLTSLNAVVEGQWQRQLLAEGKVPDVRVALRLDLAVGAREVNLSQGKTSTISGATNPANVFLILRNMGTSPFVQPTYIVTASPNTVRVDCGKQHRVGTFSVAPNVCQFNDSRNIELFSQEEIPTEFDFTVTNPGGNGFATLDIILLGRERPIQEYRVTVEFAH